MSLDQRFLTLKQFINPKNGDSFTAVIIVLLRVNSRNGGYDGR
ncbi:hypothetical protein [Shewanella donghaensis]|nr:hypothetical protein [Shewanella donghaensis]